MKLSGRNQIITDRSLIETMKAFKKAGYDGLELSILRGMTTVVAWDYLEDYTIDKVNDMSERLDLPVTALSCHHNFVTDDTIFEAQKLLLKKAKRYQVDCVIMSTPIELKFRENHTADLYSLLQKRTRELCDIAEENGVKIAIEIEPNQLFRNVDTFLDVADKVNSPALKVNFDVGHIYLSEPNLFDAVNRLADFIVYSHIDNMCRGEHCHKLPWDGEINLACVYRKLKESGFDGNCSLDIYLQDYLEVSPKCVAYVKERVFI